MAYVALALMFFAIVLFIVEMFFPGFGIFGFFGVISFVASVFITIVYVQFGFVIVLVEVASLAVIGLIAYDYIKKKQLHGKIILDETYDNEESEIGSLDYFMGKEGMTKTPLKPFGTADFNGTSIEVYSDGAYIPEHKRVKVIDISQRKIIVKQLDVN